MKLNVHERMALVPLLPQQESYAGIGEVARMKLLLQLSAEEADEVTHDVNGQLQIIPVKGAAHIKEIPVSEWMTKTLRKILRKKDLDKKLREHEVSLFEKFCMDYDQR